MKQKDYAIIIVIVIISAGLSFYLSGKIFVTAKNRQQQVEVVPVISSSFGTPSTKYFNSSAIDPTQLVNIGNNSNNNEFVNGATTSQ